jgi:hypothetical protein
MSLAKLPVLWKALERTGAEKLFRVERNPGRLLAEGFRPDPRMNAATEPAGLFFAKDREQLGRLIDPFSGPRSWGRLKKRLAERPSETEMVTAMPYPDTVTRSFTNAEWWDFLGETGEQVGIPASKVWQSMDEWGKVPFGYKNKFEDLRQQLSENLSPYDIIDIPDVYFGKGSRIQSVVRKPGKILAKIGDIYKPLGVAAPAIGAFQPETENE